MPYSKIAAILCTSAGLALGMSPVAVGAAGPQSRTAPSDAMRFPVREISDVDPFDLDDADSRATDDADLADDEIYLPDAADGVQPIAAPQADDEAPSPLVREADSQNAVDSQRELDPRMAALRDRIRRTLAYYQAKRLNTRDHNPWEVMHSIVAYGVYSDLSRNGPEGQPVNAISWLCWNGDCHQVRILEVANGRVAARKGPKVQGHPGQFLAILAQSRVATTAPIKVGNDRFTLADLIESEKLDCQTGTELTFKLISFSYYLDIDARWKNAAGQDWSIARLVREEMAAPIVGAACGGSHRLMGLAYAVRKREQSGLPMIGEFARAKKYLEDYHRYTLTKLQNSDGSFSTEWFRQPGNRPDLGRRIQTSGHILEWLSYSLPREQLKEPRVVKAVDYLSGVLNSGRKEEWSVGPLGHALHSLAIYDARVFQTADEAREADRLVEIGAPANFDDISPAADPVPAAAPARSQPRVTRRPQPRLSQPAQGSSRRAATSRP